MYITKTNSIRATYPKSPLYLKKNRQLRNSKEIKSADKNKTSK